MDRLRVVFYQELVDRDYRHYVVYATQVTEKVKAIDTISLEYWLSQLLYEIFKYQDETGEDGFKLNRRIDIQVTWMKDRFFFTQEKDKSGKSSSVQKVGFRYNKNTYLIIKLDKYGGIKEEKPRGGNDITHHIDSISYKTIVAPKNGTPVIYTGWTN